VDIAGIGFGPSNLALAIALDESADTRPLRRIFFERQRAFGWHRGMLIEGTTMQVSFLKDLVTLRNPRSRYGFVQYLHEQNRLPDFINNHTMFPSRVEFHDYLEWAARPFAAYVRYGTKVTAVRPVATDGVVTELELSGRSVGESADTTIVRTANLVVGTGITPYLPEGVNRSARIWHSAELLEAIEALPVDGVHRLVVVGAGQSAAEAAEYLHRRFPGAEICTVYSRYGYTVADDSAFANRIFDPDAVDLIFGAPQEIRQTLRAYHANTNYSVVDLELCQSLYRTQYEERVHGGEPRLRIMNASHVVDLEDQGDTVRVGIEFLPTGHVQTLQADAVIYATGYQPADPLPLLGPLAAECKRDSAGRLLLDRDFRVVTSNAVACAIYVQGAAAEPSHGISASLLSTTAVRSGEIADSIRRRVG
jgi:L-ornithine N5-oxygenase